MTERYASLQDSIWLHSIIPMLPSLMIIDLLHETADWRDENVISTNSMEMHTSHISSIKTSDDDSIPWGHLMVDRMNQFV